MVVTCHSAVIINLGDSWDGNRVGIVGEGAWAWPSTNFEGPLLIAPRSPCRLALNAFTMVLAPVLFFNSIIG